MFDSVIILQLFHICEQIICNKFLVVVGGGRGQCSIRKTNETLTLENNCLFVEEMTLYFYTFNLGIR